MPMRNKYKLGSDATAAHAARPPPAAPASSTAAGVGAGEDERSATRKPRGFRRFLERSPFTGGGGGGSGGGGGGGGGTTTSSSSGDRSSTGGITEPSTSPSGGGSGPEMSPPGASVLMDTSLSTTTAAAGATAARQTMSPPPPSATNPMEVIVEDEYSDPVDVRRRQSNEEADADDEEATNAETRVYCEPYDSKSCGDQRKDRDSAISRDSEQLTPTNFAGSARSACSRSNSMESPANAVQSSGRLSSTGRSSNSSDSRTLADSPAAFVRAPSGGSHLPPSSASHATAPSSSSSSSSAFAALSASGSAVTGVGGVGGGGGVGAPGAGSGSAGSSPCSPGARLVSSPQSADLQPRPKPFTGAARIPGSAIPIGGPSSAAAAAAAAAGGLYSSSPQGNNVITHHPASPFEPVSGATPPLIGGIAAMAVAGPIPTGPRRTSIHGPSPLAVAADPPPPSQPQPPPPPPPPLLAKETSKLPAGGGSGGGGGESDIYDEAWDVRAARLGLEFSCVQETDIDSFATIAKEGQTTPEALPSVVPSTGTTTATVVTSPNTTGGGGGGGGGPPPPQQAPPPPQTSTTVGGDTDTDYDYAYNRAWQLSQEMNRSLSFHQAASNDSGTAAPAAPPVTLPCPMPSGPVGLGPLLVAHEVLDPDCTGASSLLSSGGPSGGSGSASSPVKVRSAQPDTDSLSTDSYDEPWDVRHRRMLEDLTGGGSRFIDHPPNFMTTSMTAQGLHGGAPPPPPPHHPPPGSAAPTTGSTRRRSRNHSGPTRSEPVNPNSPLEEQPWYHSDITRAEAENLLKIHWEGSYLVRRSESNRQDFSLSIKHNKGYLHMKIVRNNRGEFILGQYSQPYSSIPAMIHHYSLSLLPIKGADHMTLQHPVSKH